jgi:hypothetical protein
MHMLVAVDEIRRASEGADEGLHLERNLSHQRVVVEVAHGGMSSRRSKRKECVPAHRLEALAQGMKRRSEPEMQPDRHPRLNGIERIERHRLRARETRRHHQHRGGIQASAHHEIANGKVDRIRNAEVVGAQPDATTPGCVRRDHVQSLRPIGTHGNLNLVSPPLKRRQRGATTSSAVDLKFLSF